jgi:hypothetical protein
MACGASLSPGTTPVVSKSIKIKIIENIEKYNKN